MFSSSPLGRCLWACPGAVPSALSRFPSSSCKCEPPAHPSNETLRFWRSNGINVLGITWGNLTVSVSARGHRFLREVRVPQVLTGASEPPSSGDFGLQSALRSPCLNLMSTFNLLGPGKESPPCSAHVVQPTWSSPPRPAHFVCSLGMRIVPLSPVVGPQPRLKECFDSWSISRTEVPV